MSPFVGQKMTNFLARPKAADLTTLKELIEADKIKPVIGSRYSLGEVPAAIAESEPHTVAERSSSLSEPTEG
jgi:NADPH:quinone reductase-like Zn-dependent oxidoreductase